MIVQENVPLAPTTSPTMEVSTPGFSSVTLPLASNVRSVGDCPVWYAKVLLAMKLPHYRFYAKERCWFAKVASRQRLPRALPADALHLLETADRDIAIPIRMDFLPYSNIGYLGYASPKP